MIDLFFTRFKCMLTWIFYLRLSRERLFRLPLSEWKPNKGRILLNDFHAVPVTDEVLVKYLSGSDDRLLSQLRKYLEYGAEGWMLVDGKQWAGYCWSIHREHFEEAPFVYFPREYEPEPNSYWCFDGRVQPGYEGLGVLYYLIIESYNALQAKDPDAVLYSNVSLETTSTFKAKIRLGEKPLGIYRSSYFRFFGYSVNNLFNSRLKHSDLAETQ